jgi:hypothetical protein
MTSSWIRVGLAVATGVALTVLAPREAFAQG